MDFFNVKKKLRKPNRKTTVETDLDDKAVAQPEDTHVAEPAGEAEDEDDEDFITNEVKRRLKELRRNSFMVLIPEEESCGEGEDNEDEAEDEGGDRIRAVSREWRDVEAEARQWWGGFDALYEKYCERMLFFDRMSAHQLNEFGCQTPTTPSPRSASKKLASPLRCLSLKKIEEPEDETKYLQQQPNDAYQDIETAYVAQICLSWEALHCQYTQLTQKIFCQPESPTCYNHSAQLLQQFQVLLQRYIENEPFEEGLRADIYARARKLWPKLLQVPNVKATEQKETEGEESSQTVLAPDLVKLIESSIISFHVFLKMEKKISNGVGLRSWSGNHTATPLYQIQSALEKKLVKLKERHKKSKGWKKISWPLIQEDVQLMFGLIDVKIISRVLKMTRITNEQLFWCEEKMKKLDFVDGKLRRDASPILFPC